jgi:hypothetical protein
VIEQNAMWLVGDHAGLGRGRAPSSAARLRREGRAPEVHLAAATLANAMRVLSGDHAGSMSTRHRW